MDSRGGRSRAEARLIIAGVGGQGVVFATRLLAHTAIALDLPVIASETHGMSQRGGSVVTHLHIGGSQAPLIGRGTADVLLAFDHDEALRNIAFLAPGGTALINTDHSLPQDITALLERRGAQVHTLHASRRAMELGTAAVTNVVVIGFALGHHALPFPLERLRATLSDLSPRGRETNLQALEVGYQAGVATARSTRPHPGAEG